MTSLKDFDEIPLSAPTEFYGNTNVLSGSDPNIYGPGSLFVNDNLYVKNSAKIKNNLEVEGDLGITGKITISKGLTLSQDLGVSCATFLNDLDVTGSTKVEDLTVNLGTTFNNSVTIDGDLNITGNIIPHPSNNIQVAKIYDEKTSGTNGGTFAAGSWQIRDLNTITQSSSFITLSSNEFTLSSGSYIMEFEVPAWEVNSHQSRLYNVSDSTIETYGTNAYGGSPSKIYHYITINTTKTYRIEHRCGLSNATNGFGIAGSWGPEIYTNGIITKYS